MDTGNILIGVNLTDEINSEYGHELYMHDCCNTPICKSYGTLAYACLAGANIGNRCSYGEKMQIRILNDSNPNAIYKPTKPNAIEIETYIKG